MQIPYHWLAICFALLALGSENIAGRRKHRLWGLWLFPEEMKCKLSIWPSEVEFLCNILLCGLIVEERHSLAKAGVFPYYYQKKHQ